MKIQLLSDLHVEFWKNINQREHLKQFQTSADVLVLAGDINVGRRNTLETLKYFSDMYPNVIYVRGNHEEYGSRYCAFLEVDTFKDKLPSNVHFLENEFIVINDSVAFIGTPLWTDFHDDPLAATAAGYGIADFSRVTGATPDKYANANANAKQFIKSAYECLPHLEKVLVTHFVPAVECVHPRWRTSNNLLLNKYFANNMGNYISTLSNTTWMFGHTHDSCDIMLGDTRMLCNPYGYYLYEQCPNFDPKKVITLN